ncbi:GxxExxY protein [Labilibaculum antarcticum]|uniref:NADH:ubiquinone oxidoreductase n=1 Tax=Labilibaculum antarcticum TaxID=1717717 RepID=A0A1Y1CE70_9BACT|nr:GxxExxY protein [Labilibaculum antarcticum]BAX78625.1 NADH:ubiquinone oxidoreductase [Labilibaculum antarcticum]
MKQDYILKKECYKIIGSCMEVHSELGCGFLEAVYQEALEIELVEKEIDFEREVELGIVYKGNQLDKKYYADFLCFDEVIVELKAVKTLDDIHTAQVLNYLKATGKRVGLLINFGATSLQYKRFIL